MFPSTSASVKNDNKGIDHSHRNSENSWSSWLLAVPTTFQVVSSSLPGQIPGEQPVKQLTKLDPARQQELARGDSNKVGQYNNDEGDALNAGYQLLDTDTPDTLQKSTVPTVTINNVGHVGPSQPSTRNSGVDQREREYLRGRLHKHN